MTSRLEELCREKGLKMTGQRRVIVRALAESMDHPDVETLFHRAAKFEPTISMATVYRTVHLLAELGMLERHAFGAGKARYEERSESHHDHLIDMRTGAVIEFRNGAIERLQEAVARELGYRLVGYRLELYAVPVRKHRNTGTSPAAKSPKKHKVC